MADIHTHLLTALAMNETVRALVLVGALLVVTIVGGVVAMLIRRRALGAHSSAAETTLPLSTIRDMHRRGELSDEEYANLRAASLAAFGVADKGGPPPTPTPPGEARTAPPGVDLAGDPLPGHDPDSEGDEGEKNRPDGV